MLENLTEKFFKKFSNQTLRYHMTDNLETNLQREKELSPELKNNEIPEDEVLYTINSLGNRCDEFTEESELPILFMGCSDTWGTGLRLNQTWAVRLLEFIKKATNKKIAYWNISRCGSSVDGQYWLLKNWINKIKPKYIFFLIPLPYRRLIYFENDLHEFRLMPPMIDYSKLQKYAMAFTDESFSLQNIEIHLNCINYITKLNNGKVFCTERWGYYRTEQSVLVNDIIPTLDNFSYIPTNGEIVDVARDRAHWGPETNRLFAELFWNNVKDKITV